MPEVAEGANSWEGGRIVQTRLEERPVCRYPCAGNGRVPGAAGAGPRAGRGPREGDAVAARHVTDR
jgi:hypothetical protein